MLRCIGLCISFLVCGSLGAHAPFITPCRQTDSDCILSSAKAALPYIVKGVPELGMPPLDPIKAKDITTNSGDLKLNFRNIVATGLGKSIIHKIERDPAKSTGFLDITCPISVVGDYTASGKLLFIDVEGDGPFEIKGGEFHGNITIKLKKNVKDGKEYYKISGFDFRYEPLSKFVFKFQNLFNGDESRAEPVTKLMNESWRELILDANIGKPVIEAALTQLVSIVNKLFQAVPAEELEIV